MLRFSDSVFMADDKTWKHIFGGLFDTLRKYETSFDYA